LEELINFGGDPVRDTNPTSLFHFRHHCKIGEFGRFITIYHTVTGLFSQLVKWLMLARCWIQDWNPISGLNQI